MTMAFHECGVLIVTFCLAYSQPTSQEQTVASNRLQQQISSARSNHGETADSAKPLAQLASQLTRSLPGKESLQLAQAGDLPVAQAADLPEFKRIAEIPDPIHDAVQLERSRYRAALAKAGDDKSLRQDANATYAKALESAIESYKKAGVQESPRLAKLKLEIKMLTHSSCMGVWERTLIATQGIRIPIYEYWVVGIDLKTGEWKITGAIRTDRISAPAPLYHGDDVTSTKDLVKFKLNIHSEHPALWPNGTAFEMTLKPESGQVTYVARSGSQKHEATLVRCTDNTMFDRIQYWDRNKGAFPELADHVGGIDIDSPVEVWQH